MISAISDVEFGLNGACSLAGHGKMGDREVFCLIENDPSMKGLEKKIRGVVQNDIVIGKSLMTRCSKIEIDVDADLCGSKFSA